MTDSLDKKRQEELDYWIGLSRELSAGCATDQERRAALLRVCHEITFPRYLDSLYLTPSSFRGMRVLDVGCGPHGGLIGFQDCEKYGLDHLVGEYQRIGYPLEEHGISYLDCKSEEMPFREGFFNAVLCVNALDHVDRLEPTIAEIARVLREGGRFIGQFNFHDRPTGTEPICLEHGKLMELCSRHRLQLKSRLFQCRMDGVNEDRYFYEFRKGAALLPSATLRGAEGFLELCVRDGLAHSLDTVSGQWVKAYPEVTGYLLSYFCSDRLELPLPGALFKAVRKLLSIQHKSGGFPSFADRERLFTFDTAQIMHGLACFHLATSDKRSLQAAVRAADFVCAMQLPGGETFPVYDLRRDARYVETDGHWGICFSPIQTKNVEGLLLMHRLTGERRYAAAAEALVAFAKASCDVSFSHPGAYCLEGLLAAGETELVRQRIAAQVLPRLEENGFLAYAADIPYAYVSGTVQMGILLHKTGFVEESRKVLRWAREVQKQHPGGGLFQYADAAGRPDGQVHLEINSWGSKYFCQLERLLSCGA